MKQPLRYLWCEIWKISWKGIFRFGATVMCFCAVWWALETHIDAWLVSWTKRWIEPLDQTAVIYAVYAVLAIGLLYGIYSHAKKNAHLRYSGWVLWTLLTIVYSFYRFNPNSPFEFWKIGEWVCADVIYLVDGILLLFALIYGIRVFRFEEKEYYKNSELLRDDAIEDFIEDEFGYQDIAKDLKWRLDSVDISKKAYSVGIAGGWGTGKSSLLNLFANKQREDGQIVVRFNPRSAKQADLIQEEFFTVFSNEIGKYSYNVQHIVGKYAYALNLHSSTSWIYSIIDLFESWTAASEKARINDLIRATGKRVYVVIEDLDRLTGEEILEVLKLIDANGNFCHTVFLTAYDKDYVNGVLRQMIGYDDRLTDFTNKYFQYELPLFKQAHQPLEDFFDVHLKTWAQAVWADEAYHTQLIEAQWPKVRELILSHIENMRQAKRYLNLFRSSYRWNKARVDFGDCAIVTLIRFLDGKTYHELYKAQYLIHPGEIIENADEWTLGDNFGEEADEEMRELVEYLFDGTAGHRQSEPRYNRICRAESFENYFHEEIKGKVYGDELDMMMNVVELQSALDLFDGFSKDEAGKKSIVEYLREHDERWIGDVERLTRYMELLVYAHTVIGGLELSEQMNGMFTTKWQKEFEECISKEGYWEGLSKAIETMMPIVPLSLGHFFRFRVHARTGNTNRQDEELVETMRYDEEMLEKAQKMYDAGEGIQAWEAGQSIALGATVKGEEMTYAKARARQLKKMMDVKPDEYARGFVHVETSDIVRSQSYVKFVPYDGVRDVMTDATLLRWAKKVKDADLRYVVEYLLTHKNEQGYPNARLGMSYAEANGKYGKIAEALRKNDGR